MCKLTSWQRHAAPDGGEGHRILPTLRLSFAKGRWDGSEAGQERRGRRRRCIGAQLDWHRSGSALHGCPCPCARTARGSELPPWPCQVRNFSPADPRFIPPGPSSQGLRCCWNLPGWRGGGRVGSFQFLMSYQGKDLVGPKKTVTTSSKMQILTDDGQLRQSDHVWPPTSMALRGTWGFTLLCQGLKSALSVTVSDWLKSPTRWLIRTVRFYLSPIKDNFNSPANRIGHSGSFA